MIRVKSKALLIDGTDSTSVRRLNEWFEEGWQYEDGFDLPSGDVLMILSKDPDDDDWTDDDDDYDDPYTR